MVRGSHEHKTKCCLSDLCPTFGGYSILRRIRFCSGTTTSRGRDYTKSIKSKDDCIE